MPPKASASYNLSVIYPELAKEVHPDSDFRADEVTPKSSKRLLWICSRGHSWHAPPYNRVKRNAQGEFIGCPHCYNDIRSEATFAAKNAGTKLSETHPHLIQHWHPANKIKPSQIAAGSATKVKWICVEGHEFTSAVCVRVRANATGCAQCERTRNGSRVKVAAAKRCSFAHYRPELVREWHPANPLSPHEVSKASKSQILWRCDMGHIYVCRVYSRTLMGTGCPECARLSQGDRSREAQATGKQRLQVTHPHLVGEWSSVNTKPISDFTKGSGFFAQWVCQEGHQFGAYIYNRADGHGCPQCWGEIRRHFASVHAESRQELFSESLKDILKRQGGGSRRISRAIDQITVDEDALATVRKMRETLGYTLGLNKPSVE